MSVFNGKENISRAVEIDFYNDNTYTTENLYFIYTEIQVLEETQTTNWKRLTSNKLKRLKNNKYDNTQLGR